MIIGNIFTLLSYISYYISRFCKTKSNMCIWDAASKLLTIIAFIFLNALNGVYNNILALFRPIAVVLKEKTGKKLHWLFIIFLILHILIFIFTYAGISSILISIVSIASLYFLFYSTTQTIRLTGTIGNIVYMLYQLSINNYIGVICEIIVLACNVISFVKYSHTTK